MCDFSVAPLVEILGLPGCKVWSWASSPPSAHAPARVLALTLGGRGLGCAIGRRIVGSSGT